MKHAYCILAHNEPELFCSLISLLDDSLNDIYVHIDKRSDIAPFKKAKCEHSSLCFLKNRKKSKWGSFHIVEAELSLFEEARKYGPYDYYHLISGVDLPLKSQAVIHKFFEDNKGSNFIGTDNSEDVQTQLSFRGHLFHPFICRFTDSFQDRIRKAIYLFVLRLQRTLHIQHSIPFSLCKGPQWMSITDDFCDYLLKRKKSIKHFRYSLCPDEMAIQSVFVNSPFRETQFMPNAEQNDQCVRKIDWKRGLPYTWQGVDYYELINSDKLFARKFSSEHMEIVRALSCFLNGE